MIQSVEVTYNRVIDPLLQATDLIAPGQTQKIITLAIPFLNLNPLMAKASSIGLGLYNCYYSIQNLHEESNWIEFGKKTGMLVITITATAFAIFFPFGQFVISNTFGLLAAVQGLTLHLWNCQWLEAGTDCMRLAMQLTFIASTLFGTPELIFLSIFIQVLSELNIAYEELLQEHYLETMAHILLASIRAYGAAAHVQTLHRNYFGPQLTQQKWNQLYQKILGGRTLEELLIEQGISSHVKNISFVKTAYLVNTEFHGIDFKNCDFTDVNFTNSRFSHVTADSCLFKNTTWVNTALQRCHFNQCNFSFSYFNDSSLNQVLFNRCGLLETCFLGAYVKRSEIARSDLTDCLLLTAKEQFRLTECTANTFTRPLVGLIWQFRVDGIFNPLMEAAIKDNGAIPVRIEVDPKNLNHSRLNNEVTSSLAEINSAPNDNMLSPASELIRQAKPGTELAKITNQVALYAKFLDGIMLTGGEDIFPDSYGDKMGPDTFTSGPNRNRMVYEYALLSQAHEHNIPTMGICRGSQLINVYFGGTLNQNIPWGADRNKPFEITDSSYKDWAQKTFGQDFIGLSAHHQASKRIGKDLEVVLKVGDIPKLILSKDGNFIASQFHPEAYLEDKENQKEMQILLDKWDEIRFSYQILFPAQYQHLKRFYDKLADEIKVLNTKIERNQSLYRLFSAKTQAHKSRRTPSI